MAGGGTRQTLHTGNNITGIAKANISDYVVGRADRSSARQGAEGRAGGHRRGGFSRLPVSEAEVDVVVRDNLDQLAVQQRRLMAPLADGLDGGASEVRVDLAVHHAQ